MTQVNGGEWSLENASNRVASQTTLPLVHIALYEYYFLGSLSILNLCPFVLNVRVEILSNLFNTLNLRSI